MVNNFKELSNFIKKNDSNLTDDNFYFCQVIRRNKDNQGGNKTIRDFYIKDSEDLLNKQDDIIAFCEMFGARAYFNPNVKSYKKCHISVMKRMVSLIETEDYKACRGLFSSAAGLVETRDTYFDKIWLIDYDHGDNLTQIELYLAYSEILFTQLETKNGFHYLVKPFRLDLCPFSDKIQKHNPTLLYIGG